MSFPTFGDDHDVTRAVDELFGEYDVERVENPSARRTEEEMYGDDQYRAVVNFEGAKSVPVGLHRTSDGVVYVEESGDGVVEVVVDTEADVEDEHPASY